MRVVINRISLDRATQILKRFRNEVDMLDLYNDYPKNRISVNINFKENEVDVSTITLNICISKRKDSKCCIKIPKGYYDSVIINE